MTDTPKFPEAQDDDVLTATAEEVWKQIAKWMGESEPDDHEEAVKLMVDSMGVDDGYALARDFEKIGRFQPDAQLVEILDGYMGKIHQTCRKMRKEWVTKTGWQPAFKVGDLVMAPVSKFNSAEPCCIGGILADEGPSYIERGDVPKADKYHIGAFIVAHTEVKPR